MLDHAFVQMSDWQRAQRLANGFSLRALQRKLDDLAERFCPVGKRFAHGYHFSLMQVEYALDIVFKKAEALQPIYEEISPGKPCSPSERARWRAFWASA